MRRQSICVAAMLVIAAGALVAGPVARAHEGATGVVRERMELMKKLGASAKSISAMLRGEVAYDASRVREAARNLADHSGDRITVLFPEGSLPAPTAAKPVIWQEWQRFSGYAEELRRTARALEAVAKRRNGPENGETPDTVFKRLTRTCSGCHRHFRKPEH